MTELQANSLLDDSVDVDLRNRIVASNEQDSLQWLLDFTGKRPEDLVPIVEQKAEPSEEGGWLPSMERIAKSTEIPRQMVGGVRDAVQNVLDLGDWLERMVPLGGTEIDVGMFPPRAGFKLLSPEELARKREEQEGLAQLPQIAPAETLEGGVVRAVTQFLVPFAAAGRAIGGLQGATKLGTIGRSMTAGAMADFLAFDPHEERLANLLNEVPVLKDIVPDWLNAEEDDSELEGRLKNTIEGAGLGVLSEGLFKGLRLLRSARKLRKQPNIEELTQEGLIQLSEGQRLRAASELKLLGSTDPEVPHIVSAREARQSLKMPKDTLKVALTGRGLAQLRGSEDIYVNFAKVDTAADIDKLVSEAAPAFAEDVRRLQRGLTPKSLESLTPDQISAWDALVRKRQGPPLQPSELLATRQLWATSGSKLAEVAAAAVQSETPENLFQLRKMLATHSAIERKVVGSQQGADYALQGWELPAGGRFERMQAINEALERSGGKDVSETVALKVLALSRGPEAARKLSRFASKVAEGTTRKTIRTIQEFWVNALLSGPKTHFVNILSNASVVGLSMGERFVAEQAGKLIGDEMLVGEAAAQVQALRGGLLDALRAAGHTLRTETTVAGRQKVEGPRRRMVSAPAWNLNENNWPGQFVNGLGAVVNFPGRMLAVEDEFFKSINYRMELHAQAQRLATAELKKGTITPDQFAQRFADILDDPSEELRIAAREMAAYNTFTSEPGFISRGILRFTSRHPVAKFLAPFVTTPGNILKFTFERTPLAPLTARYRHAIALGGPDAMLARTRMAMGTATLMVAMDLAMNGYITGSGPTKPAEREAWFRQGYRPYSVRLGDQLFAYNRLDPLGYHLGIAADISEYILNADDTEVLTEEYEEAVGAAAFAIIENITSKSYLQGFSMFVEALNDPGFVGPFMERMAGSFVPVAVREVASAMDPVQRHSHNMVTSLKTRLPAFSETEPARRDLWGRPKSFRSDMGTIYDAVSPIYASTIRPEPIDEAMQRDGWFLGMGGYSFQVKGETVSLRNRPDIKNRYYQLRGGTKPSEMGKYGAGLLSAFGDRTMLEVMNDMVTGVDPRYGAMWQRANTPEERKKLATSIFRAYGQSARGKLFEEYPWIEDTALRLKSQKLDAAGAK